jgi:hypothetical protein
MLPKLVDVPLYQAPNASGGLIGIGGPSFVEAILHPTMVGTN